LASWPHNLWVAGRPRTTVPRHPAACRVRRASPEAEASMTCEPRARAGCAAKATSYPTWPRSGAKPSGLPHQPDLSSHAANRRPALSGFRRRRLSSDSQRGHCRSCPLGGVSAQYASAWRAPGSHRPRSPRSPQEPLQGAASGRAQSRSRSAPPGRPLNRSSSPSLLHQATKPALSSPPAAFPHPVPGRLSAVYIFVLSPALPSSVSTGQPSASRPCPERHARSSTVSEYSKRAFAASG